VTAAGPSGRENGDASSPRGPDAHQAPAAFVIPSLAELLGAPRSVVEATARHLRAAAAPDNPSGEPTPAEAWHPGRREDTDAASRIRRLVQLRDACRDIHERLTRIAPAPTLPGVDGDIDAGGGWVRLPDPPTAPGPASLTSLVRTAAAAEDAARRALEPLLKRARRIDDVEGRIVTLERALARLGPEHGSGEAATRAMREAPSANGGGGCSGASTATASLAGAVPPSPRTAVEALSTAVGRGEDPSLPNPDPAAAAASAGARAAAESAMGAGLVKAVSASATYVCGWAALAADGDFAAAAAAERRGAEDGPGPSRYIGAVAAGVNGLVAALERAPALAPPGLADPEVVNALAEGRAMLASGRYTLACSSELGTEGDGDALIFAVDQLVRQVDVAIGAELLTATTAVADAATATVNASLPERARRAVAAGAIAGLPPVRTAARIGVAHRCPIAGLLAATAADAVETVQGLISRLGAMPESGKLPTAWRASVVPLHAALAGAVSAAAHALATAALHTADAAGGIAALTLLSTAARRAREAILDLLGPATPDLDDVWGSARRDLEAGAAGLRKADASARAALVTAETVAWLRDETRGASTPLAWLLSAILAARNLSEGDADHARRATALAGMAALEAVRDEPVEGQDGQARSVRSPVELRFWGEVAAWCVDTGGGDMGTRLLRDAEAALAAHAPAPGGATGRHVDPDADILRRTLWGIITT